MRLSPDALAGLLRPPPPKPKQPTSRERAAATGLRRMEATWLELGDVDAGRCVVLIREGKGRKDRLLRARGLAVVQGLNARRLLPRLLPLSRCSAARR